MSLEFKDQELVDEIRAGSAVAFEQLLRRYERLVLKIAIGFTRDGEAARDVAQNVFLRVHAKLPVFRKEGNLKNWIIRIAMNESMNWNRARRRHQATELNEEIAAGPPSPQETLLGEKERWAQLKRSLTVLNPRQQLAVALRYFDGMSIREISAVLECSEGTVKSILFRSLGKMRARLAASTEVPS